MSDALRLCRRRVLALEKAIAELLQAEAAGEMGNRDKALEKLQRLMERV